METERKTLIGDAAIALLASAGAKGLTHRAVDAQAGLPTGSTSFYCRTRHELLSLALRRHAALDLADLQADARQWARVDISPDRFVEALARRVADWLSPGKRARLVARFELCLIASREPELAAIVDELRGRFMQGTVDTLRRAGVADADLVASRLIMAVDGMLLSQVASRGQAMTAAQCQALLSGLFQPAGA